MISISKWTKTRLPNPRKSDAPIAKKNLSGHHAFAPRANQNLQKLQSWKSLKSWRNNARSYLQTATKINFGSRNARMITNLSGNREINADPLQLRMKDGVGERFSLWLKYSFYLKFINPSVPGSIIGVCSRWRILKFEKKMNETDKIKRTLSIQKIKTTNDTNFTIFVFKCGLRGTERS